MAEDVDDEEEEEDELVLALDDEAISESERSESGAGSSDNSVASHCRCGAPRIEKTAFWPIFTFGASASEISARTSIRSIRPRHDDRRGRLRRR